MRFGVWSASTTALTLALSAVAGSLAVVGPEAEAAAQTAARRPWLGVEFDGARAEGRGARVRHAVRGSPAWNAGVRDGDMIVRIEEAAVTRADDVIREIGTRAPGAIVHLAVLRGPTEVALTATLTAMPDNDEMLRLDKIGAPAPNWKGLSQVSGPVPVGLNELKGRVVILDFWATWCLACRMSAPKLTAWQAKFGAQGLSVIGITDDPVDEASQAARSFGMRYHAIATDPSYTTQRAFGVRALPTVFVIDKRGVIRDVSVGFDPRKETEMEALVQRLLAEPSP